MMKHKKVTALIASLALCSSMLSALPVNAVYPYIYNKEEYEEYAKSITGYQEINDSGIFSEFAHTVNCPYCISTECFDSYRVMSYKGTEGIYMERICTPVAFYMATDYATDNEELVNSLINDIAPYLTMTYRKTGIPVETTAVRYSFYYGDTPFETVAADAKELVSRLKENGVNVTRLSMTDFACELYDMIISPGLLTYLNIDEAELTEYLDSLNIDYELNITVDENVDDFIHYKVELGEDADIEEKFALAAKIKKI